MKSIQQDDELSILSLRELREELYSPTRHACNRGPEDGCSTCVEIIDRIIEKAVEEELEQDIKNDSIITKG